MSSQTHFGGYNANCLKSKAELPLVGSLAFLLGKGSGDGKHANIQIKIAGFNAKKNYMHTRESEKSTDFWIVNIDTVPFYGGR